MSNNDFMKQQQAAVERMREMNARAAKNAGAGSMPPVPPFVKVPRQEGGQKTESRTQTPKIARTEPQTGSSHGLFDLPFLKNLTGDADVSLILGLLLILMSENADKKLLFALVYILL